MRLFSTNVTEATTEEVLRKATNKITDDIVRLVGRRGIALSIFRDTADELAEVNDELGNSLKTLEDLRTFINEQTTSTAQMIAENEAVRTKILEIINPQITE